MEKMKKNAEEEKREAMTRLLDILKQCKNEKDYNGNKKGVKLTFSNLKASSSGMSRKFNIHVITKKGELLNITYLISKVMGETFTSDGLMRVYGCGMDMLFNTCYELNCAIYRLKGHKKYNHDIAYHGFVDTSYNLL